MLGARLTLTQFLLFSLACSTSSTLPDSDGGADSGRDTALDIGADVCTPPPPGPGTVCAAGPCCDDIVARIGIDDLCAPICPEGHSTSCELDPAAFCGPIEFFACENPSECTLTPARNECCRCQDRESNTTAVRVDSAEAYRAMLEPGPDCDAVDCAACPPRSPLDPRLVAACTDNRCTVESVRPSPQTECVDDSDCRVRALECCECGADISLENLTAIRTDGEAAFAELYCDDGAGCFECAPDYRGFEAFCAEDDHCAVRPSVAP